VSIPHFATSEHDPHRRGALIGARWRDRIHATCAGYERLFAASGADRGVQQEIGDRALERTAGWAPRLADEIRGIASGAGLEDGSRGRC
jgi:isopenicillin-N N-acyltransferase-like protein